MMSSLLFDKNTSLGNKPVIMILIFGHTLHNASTIETMPSLISTGVFLSMLFVPQCITATFRSLGRLPFIILHNTFCVLSPPMPKFRASNGSKYFFHTVLYLNKPFTIESPINSTVDLELPAILVNFLCKSFHPGLL